VKTKHKEERE